MTRMFNKVSAMAFLLLFSVTVSAQNDTSLMTYDMAAKAMDAAEKYAREKGWNLTILVVDQNSKPVMMRRMDGASPRTFEIATAKALVVTTLGYSSGEYGTKLAAGEVAEIEGGVTYQGGVPVYVNGQMIGAVTSSGARGNEDEEASIAGAQTIGSITKN